MSYEVEHYLLLSVASVDGACGARICFQMLDRHKKGTPLPRPLHPRLGGTVVFFCRSCVHDKGCDVGGGYAARFGFLLWEEQRPLD
jgi:hypothetical protein